jgi:hypothetical protein
VVELAGEAMLLNLASQRPVKVLDCWVMRDRDHWLWSVEGAPWSSLLVSVDAVMHRSGYRPVSGGRLAERG